MDKVVSAVAARFLLQVFNRKAGGVGVVVGDGNEEPDDPSDDKEDGGEEEAIVISELGDEGRGSNSSAGASDLIEDVLKRGESKSCRTSSGVNIRR